MWVHARSSWGRAPTLLACFQKVLFNHSSYWSSKRINDGTIIMAKYTMYIHTWLNWAWFFVNNKYHPKHSIAHEYSSISVSIPAMKIITYCMQATHCMKESIKNGGCRHLITSAFQMARINMHHCLHFHARLNAIHGKRQNGHTWQELHMRWFTRVVVNGRVELIVDQLDFRLFACWGCD